MCLTAFRRPALTIAQSSFFKTQKIPSLFPQPGSRREPLIHILPRLLPLAYSAFTSLSVVSRTTSPLPHRPGATLSLHNGEKVCGNGGHWADQGWRSLIKQRNGGWRYAYIHMYTHTHTHTHIFLYVYSNESLHNDKMRCYNEWRSNDHDLRCVSPLFFPFLVLYIGRVGYWEGRVGGKQGWFPQDAIQPVSKQGTFRKIRLVSSPPTWSRTQIEFFVYTLPLQQRLTRLPISQRAQRLQKQRENEEARRTRRMLRRTKIVKFFLRLQTNFQTCQC